MSNSRYNSTQNSANNIAGPSNVPDSAVSSNNGALRYAMSRSLAKTTQQDEDNMPASTLRAYGRKQDEFSKWAKKTFVDEPEMMRDIVSGVKLNYFLHEEVNVVISIFTIKWAFANSIKIGSWS